jgi:hypothetical protein
MESVIKHKVSIITALCLIVAITVVATKIFAVYNITCACNDLILNTTNSNTDINRHMLKLIKKLNNSTMFRVA